MQEAHRVYSWYLPVTRRYISKIVRTSETLSSKRVLQSRNGLKASMSSGLISR